MKRASKHGNGDGPVSYSTSVPCCFHARERNLHHVLVRLSELLGLAVPVIPSLVPASSVLAVTAGASSFNAGDEIGGPGSLWADEEDKKFYEELRELKGEVPGTVLGIAVEKDKNAVYVEEVVEVEQVDP